MANTTYDVFVSYSRADARHAADIDSVLRSKGLRPFFDRRSLAPLSQGNLARPECDVLAIMPRRVLLSFAKSFLRPRVVSNTRLAITKDKARSRRQLLSLDAGREFSRLTVG